MAQAVKCAHKGCGKVFTNPDEDCVYHPGPPVFHEGQKGWNCCKPRVLTFDEFLSIPPCTTGKHSMVDDTPAPPPKTTAVGEAPVHAPKPISAEAAAAALAPPRAPQPAAAAPQSTPEPETEDDEALLPIALGKTCRRRGCGASATADTAVSREGEKCVFHPGQPIFHEGSKGWTCCKRRVLEFDEFMKIGGCQEKSKHLFVGSGRKDKGEGVGANVKMLDAVRHDYYQTSTMVHASYYLKKIKKEEAKIAFTSHNSIDVDLPTTDNTIYRATIQLYGAIDIEKSTYKIMGTKLDINLAKADSMSWAVLQADDPRTGEIIQTGKAGRA